MAAINFYVPRIQRSRFTGGIACALEYANRLHLSGHTVRVIPGARSRHPAWIHQRAPIVRPRFAPVHTALRRQTKVVVRQLLGRVLTRIAPYASYSFSRAADLERAAQRLPPADLSISTAYETVLPMYVYGTGRKYYFAQHFEPLFASDRDSPKLATWDALSTYFLPNLQIIANSSWLSGLLSPLLAKQIPVCNNAIDTDVFQPSALDRGGPFTVITYSGRGAIWKGFEDAARAIAIARNSIPDLRWLTFGEPPAKHAAEDVAFEHLGFLSGSDLRNAYCSAHVLLAPAWFESFPLYPLEAMACGTVPVTTRYGTEDYAEHMRNAIVTWPHQPDALANGIVTLAANSALLSELQRNGLTVSQRFQWNQAFSRFAELIEL